MKYIDFLYRIETFFYASGSCLASGTIRRQMRRSDISQLGDSSLFEKDDQKEA